MLSNSKPADNDLSPDTMIPDLIRNYPSARLVLDKYGLKGCGGPEGPYESLRFFARAHDIDEHSLLCEIESTLLKQKQTGATSELEAQRPDLADTIYRRFFIAAIVITVTLGATWGAYLLWKIGILGYDGVSSNEINAHGQAQIFGWMGLFIMGFAYQAFPRFWHTTLVAPQLAVAAFLSMLAGILGATVGFALANHSALGLPIGLGGSLLELAAISVFLGQLLATFKRSDKRLEPYIGFVFCSLLWFLISSIYNCWHVWNVLGAVSDSRMLYYVNVFQPALRDMQFLGLGMLIIIGVSLRTLPHFYDLTKIEDRRGWLLLVLLMVAVSMQTGFSLAVKLLAAFPQWLLPAPPALMLLGTLALIRQWKLWRKFPESDRSAKFVRAAYSWLLISLSMLIGLPIYDTLPGVPSAHAFTAATHHAMTVGFISMMIMGHAAKVVPTLNGINPKKLTRLWGPFLLINIGCLLRVVTQIATDWTQHAYSIIGLSGTLEVIALSWWGWHLVSIMVKGKREESRLIAMPATSTLPAISYPITADTNVLQLVETHPETLPIFVSYGFTPLANPVLRKLMARNATIAKACKMLDIEVMPFLVQINHLIAEANKSEESVCHQDETN